MAFIGDLKKHIKDYLGHIVTASSAPNISDSSIYYDTTTKKHYACQNGAWVEINKIVAGGVTATELATNAVETVKIKDASVTNVKMANDRPYVNARIGAETASGNKSFNTVSSSGFTVASTRLTSQVAGRYFINCRQLVNNSTNGLYFSIVVNGSIVSHGYLVASTMADVGCSAIVDLAVGGYVEVSQSHSVTGCWTSTHSDFQIIKL
jgi:hypothetical protein